MNQIVVIAGLPIDAYDRLFRESRKRLLPNGHIIAKPVKWAGYDPHLTTEYIKDAYNHILTLREGAAVSISVLYVDYGTDVTATFLESFFPFALVRPVRPIEPDVARTVKDRNARLNDYHAYLEAELDVLKKRIPVIRHFTSVHNLTPLLLPYANFSGAEFQEMVRRLYGLLGVHPDPSTLLDSEIATFLAQYPRVYPKSEGHHRLGHHCLSDGKLYFKSPGGDRHGFFRPGRDPGHMQTCLLNARSRLGGSYAHNFHFDCEPTSGGLNKTYPNCHAAPTPPKKQHVNIAPNDYIIG
jgi:hypothetical protein